MHKICRFLYVKILTSHNFFAIRPISKMFMGDHTPRHVTKLEAKGEGSSEELRKKQGKKRGKKIKKGKEQGEKIEAICR